MLSNAREFFSTFNRHYKESQEYNFAKKIAKFLAEITNLFDFIRMFGNSQKLTDALYTIIHTYMDFNRYSKLTKPHQEAIFYYIIKTIVSNNSRFHQSDDMSVFIENIEKINNFIKEPTKQDFFLHYQLGVDIGNREEFLNSKTLFHQRQKDAVIFTMVYFLSQFISASKLRALSKESRQELIKELSYHIVNFSPKYTRPYNVIEEAKGVTSYLTAHFGSDLSDIITRTLQNQLNQVIPYFFSRERWNASLLARLPADIQRELTRFIAKGFGF